MSTENNICLVPACERKAQFRGLCNSHYNYAAFLVREGKTSWEELEANGKTLPKRSRQQAHWLLDFKKGKKK